MQEKVLPLLPLTTYYWKKMEALAWPFDKVYIQSPRYQLFHHKEDLSQSQD